MMGPQQYQSGRNVVMSGSSAGRPLPLGWVGRSRLSVRLSVTASLPSIPGGWRCGRRNRWRRLCARRNDWTWCWWRRAAPSHHHPGRVVPGRPPSNLLAAGILSRSFTRVSQVTGLIQQQGADPIDVQPLLRVKGRTTTRFAPFPLLPLCIDNLTDNRIPSIWAADGDDRRVPVALPLWRTRGLQEGVMRSLIEEGADINAIPTDEDGFDCPGATPIRVAIKACNEKAFHLLMAEAGLQLGGRQVMRVPWTLETDRPTEDHEATLLSFYQQLLDRAPTLAAETDAGYGGNPVHWVAFTRPVWSQSFIDSYIGLLVANGADMTAVDYRNATPLHCAADCGGRLHTWCPCIHPNDTPLAAAAQWLDKDIQRLDDDTAEAADKDKATSEIPHLKSTIRVLLQAGADIARLRTDTERDRRRRRLVLPEYKTVLNEDDETPLAIRDMSAVAWRVASFFVDPSALEQTPRPVHNATLFGRRINKAMEVFVRSAVSAAGNQQVVGSGGSNKRDSQGERVRRPPLQCFVLGGADGRRLGVREVIHRARLDEAAQHGVEGVVKGFNTHLGDSDCQFQWQQLGYVGSGGGFESLAAAFQPPAGPSDSEASDDSSGDDLDEGEDGDGGEGSAGGVGDVSDEGEGHGHDDDDMMEEE
ncbi:unnamed protein product [Vitrella brassicaformis CCMP3155]|uniref:Uncharacterized protein n=1 Tax=Vitrella brassicaformis (strain CCMP3155) TaxID=1169540 RepID=A0A0G4EW85_VITBC|nr:unnamed protein product [Vitrella brassicaformis CCMP3155]|eukprot:CEM03217.1 unnamed protein product [Vitrella brassicaformis CCMP3155]